MGRDVENVFNLLEGIPRKGFTKTNAIKMYQHQEMKKRRNDPSIKCF